MIGLRDSPHLRPPTCNFSIDNSEKQSLKKVIFVLIQSSHSTNEPMPHNHQNDLHNYTNTSPNTSPNHRKNSARMDHLRIVL